MGKYKNFEHFDEYLNYLVNQIESSNDPNKETNILYLESLRNRDKNSQLHTDLRIFHHSLCRNGLSADDYYIFLLKIERDLKNNI
jgi:hypothetical protein